MKILKKMLIVVLMSTLLINSSHINALASLKSSTNNRNIVNIGVLFYSLNDPFISLIKKGLEDIQVKNQDKVNFTFYDGKDNITTQFETIDTLLQSNMDLLIVNLTDTKKSIVEEVINKVKQKNIPLILINIDPEVVSTVSKYYSKVAFIDTDVKQSGTIQGKIIADSWSNKKIIDKNRDNVLQYIMLQGDINSEIALDRTNYSISKINDSGIKMQQLDLKVANWNRELAKDTIESLFLKYDDKIEAIISNDDSMAIGAIDALQKYGYNKEDKSKFVPIFGINGIQEAKDLVDKGIMAGTVIQDPNFIAEAFYLIGLNLINGVNPAENTNYTYSDGRIIIPVPHYEYVK